MEPRPNISPFRTTLAIFLSIVLAAETVPAELLPLQASNPFSITIPAKLGYITYYYSVKSSQSGNRGPIYSNFRDKPDIILIQNLHVNRSVQFAISGILKRLGRQGLLPRQIAVEGAAGPMDIASMQAYPDAKTRRLAADYLVRQGEMPGPMHFAVTEGKIQLYGVETDEVYRANLQVFRRSYYQRRQLMAELMKLEDWLPTLKKDPQLKEKAELLQRDVDAVSQLVHLQVIPDQLPQTLHQTAESIES
jgi:hypothetical protein